MTASTRTSGADAPAVIPTFSAPSRADQSMSPGPWIRKERSQPAARATSTRRCELDELGAPITSSASQRGAIAFTADWRLVVA